MLKAILFDLDNTLIDFWKMKKNACEAAIDAMISAGLKMERNKAIKSLFSLYKKYGIEYQKIFQKFLEKNSGKVNYRILAHGIIAYKKIKETYIYPYPKTIPTLIELKKKYKLAIISDAPRINAWMRLVELNIDEFFDIIITAADVRKQKNYAAPYRAALKELNIKPEEALMVGDRIKRDIVTAKKLGIHTCYARYGRYAEEKPAPVGKSGAEFEIDSIDEVMRVVDEMKDENEKQILQE
jgi:putative hydrolase of the HAD superfamily